MIDNIGARCISGNIFNMCLRLHVLYFTRNSSLQEKRYCFLMFCKHSDVLHGYIWYDSKETRKGNKSCKTCIDETQVDGVFHISLFIVKFKLINEKYSYFKYTVYYLLLNAVQVKLSSLYYVKYGYLSGVRFVNMNHVCYKSVSPTTNLNYRILLKRYFWPGEM